MAEVDLFLSLPTELSVSIIGKWLPIKCITCLDSAFCNRAAREMFLRLLQDPGCTVEELSYVKSDRIYHYVALRQLKLLNLVIRRGFQLDVIEKVLELSSKSLKAVSVFDPEYYTSLAMYLVAKHCCIIYVMCLKSCELDFSFRNILEKNAGLSALYLCSVSKLSTSLASMKCPSLQTLRLIDCAFKNKDLKALLCVPDGNLLKLEIKDCAIDSEQVLTIADHCSKLTALFINTYQQIGSALVTVSEKCTFIRNLQVCGVPLLEGDLQAIISNLTELRILRLEDIWTVSDSDLEQLGELHGGTLTHLSIRHCPSYTAQGMCVLLEACTELDELCLYSEIAQITPEVIESLQHTIICNLYISSPTTTEVKNAICEFEDGFFVLGLYCDCPIDDIVRIAAEHECLKRLYLIEVEPGVIDIVRAVNAVVDIIEVVKFPEFEF